MACRFAATLIGALAAAIAAADVTHPLDPLQPDEYRAVRDTLRAAGHLTDASLFASIRLEEPAKAAVLAWQPDDPIARTALAVVRDGARTIEARVDLVARRVLSFDRIDGAQAGILLSEWEAAQQIVLADDGWQRAMRRRGYRRIDPDAILCLPLASGYFAEPALDGRRVIRVQCTDLAGTRKHVYQRPIENLTAIVDLVERRVVDLRDGEPVPVPAASGNYDEASLEPYRPAFKPLTVAQPDGPSYRRSGSFVEWGPWRFHLRMDRRRGTMISLATFDGRSVLYQASLSEMWVPYMDPADGWYFKNYFDAGEYGFGLFATALAPGVDCPPHAELLAHTIALDDAEPVPYPNVMCLFERPTMAPAWRHSEGTNSSYAGRPARELVVRMIAAIGNYDYVFDWLFRPTGAIQTSIASTGIDITKAVRARTMRDPTAAEDTRYGTLIAPHLVGVNHDHFFSLRFDLDVDGPVNRFVRDRIVPEGLAEPHPRRSLWRVHSERVRTEHAAQLNIDLARPEQWRIESASATNALGNPTGYVIAPSRNARPQLSLDDWPLRRAGFARHHLWVTPYHPAQLFSAGDYPNQSTGGHGLPEWTAGNRSIDTTDLVVWYTLGFHHITAAEDWPVLPAHAETVTLKPFNFFDRSQVINLPPPAAP